jgi:hypothetical protein
LSGAAAAGSTGADFVAAALGSAADAHLPGMAEEYAVRACGGADAALPGVADHIVPQSGAVDAPLAGMEDHVAP